MIEENAVKSRLLKVQKHANRYARADAKKDKSLRRRLREPVKVDERLLALAERLKKTRMLQSIYIS